MAQRMIEILQCIWFGIIPWWMYERTCHHPGKSYAQHAKINFRYALYLLRGGSLD